MQFTSLLILLFQILTVYSSDSKNSNFQNVSSTLDKLLKNYDIRLRPKFGAETLNVSMEVMIASFDAISEVNMDYTITIYLNQFWNDERLVFGNENDYLTLMGDFAEKIWLPDTFLANDKFSFLHDVTEKNKMIKIYGNGDVIYGMRFTTTLACMMDLHNYPLDSQNCTVEIESYGYTNKEVNICWKNSKESVKGVDKVHLPQFQILNYKTSTYLEQQATGHYTRLSLSFLLQRHIGYFIFQTYLPSTLIVMLSWVSFWINHEATSARVSLGITTVLTMTTISTGVRASLPRISYVKAIDIYLVTCFVFVFAALLEYAAVNYSYWSKRANKRKRLNQAIDENINQCYEANDTVHKISKTKTRKKETSFILESDLNRMSPLPWFYSAANSKKNSSSHSLSRTDKYTDPENPRESLYTKSDLDELEYYNINQDKIRTNSIVNYKASLKNRKRPDFTYRKSKHIETDLKYNKKPKHLYQNGGSNYYVNKGQTNKHLWNSIRYKAKGLKLLLPTVKDISIIDKYNDCFYNQHVFEPTFQNANGVPKNILDLIITDSNNRIFSIKHGPPLGATNKGNHTLSWCYDLELSDTAKDNFRVSKYNYLRGDYNSMSQFKQNINWIKFFEGSDINQMYTKFLKLYDSVCEKFIPKFKKVKKDKPWMNKNLKALIRKKYSSKECRKEIRKAVFTYEMILAKKSKTNPKLIYKYINNNQVTNNSIRALDLDGKIISEPENELNKFFQSVFTTNSSKHTEFLDYKTNVKCDPQPENLGSREIIFKKLENLDPNKSTGPDGVHTCFKKCSPCIFGSDRNYFL
ncbi:unnamed protein product [Brachionus calyciflorus]|uniref:Gamma-aminobutyric acid receptor subunit beta n=1 Tax=Brachionus calyciflorus TaxID=104777 RepID=A0A814FKY9_9BILA|nr:unnamed protein product [Brachionus calyciflorus]